MPAGNRLPMHQGCGFPSSHCTACEPHDLEADKSFVEYVENGFCLLLGRVCQASRTANLSHRAVLVVVIVIVLIVVDEGLPPPTLPKSYCGPVNQMLCLHC